MNVATSRQFGAFLVVGGIAAAANVGSRIGFSHFMPYAPAIVCAYIVGMTVAFLLNRAFVFRTPSHGLQHQVLWFTAVNLAAVTQTLVVSLLLAGWLFPAIGMQHHVETVSHIIGVLVPVGTSYLGHRFITFR